MDNFEVKINDKLGTYRGESLNDIVAKVEEIVKVPIVLHKCKTIIRKGVEKPPLWMILDKRKLDQGWQVVLANVRTLNFREGQ